MNFESDRSDIQVILYGGLGNQLFQYGTALSEAIIRGTEIKVSLIGETRSSRNNLPDLFDYKLPRLAEYDIYTEKKSNLVKAGIRALLMFSNSENPNVFVRRMTKAIGYFLSLLLRIRTRKFIAVPSGLGFDPRFSLKNARHLLLGNFHSYRWISPAAKKLLLQEFKLKMNNPLINKYEKLAMEENPTAVHIRLGDYLDIQELNVISKEYFARALNYLNPNGENRVLWIFTNDENRYPDYLPDDQHFEIRVISNLLSPCETLEVMRLCNSHIISNSTFSWWGAFLGRNQHGMVIAPKQWFRNRKDPLDICPPEWVRL